MYCCFGCKKIIIGITIIILYGFDNQGLPYSDSGSA